ncbi:MAG: twin transmembrane helix small protein [Rickettsiaceae bacterium]
MLFIIFFTGLTTMVLLTGLISMAIGGKFSKKHTTKLMALRVSLQGLAILFLAIAYLSWPN